MTAALGKSGRDLVAYFAGHLANLVNGNDHLRDDATIVEVKAFQLYERVHRLLTTNRLYAQSLVGVWSYPPPSETAEAADFYFDTVLDRPIGRRAGAPSSTDHLQALIVSRAVGPFPALASEDLSTWKALVAGPSRLRRFLDRRDLFELSNRILKCLDAANRPYAEVLRMGLCPKDWLTGEDAVSVNTLKAANAFLKSLKAAMGGEVGRRPSLTELDAAWAAAPVPGHDKAASFAASALGGAMITRLAGQDHTALISYDRMEEQLGEAEIATGDDPLMTSQEALPILERAVAAGAVMPEEKVLLAAILEGLPIAEAMRDNLALRRRLKSGFGNDLGAYVDDLSRRLADFVAAAETRP
jgi:hypothetical protein